MENEIWKDISGYGGKYQISNFGNVKSYSKWKNGGLLKPSMKGNPGPYLCVLLVKNGRKDKRTLYIHRLVAEHFLQKEDDKTEVNHIDGNTLNNCFWNLEWCTHSENMMHASRSGVLSKGQERHRGDKHPNAKAVLQYDLSGNLIREWGSVNQIMRETGILAGDIFKCCNPHKYPHYKTVKGFKWRYKNGEANNKDTNP